MRGERGGGLKNRFETREKKNSSSSVTIAFMALVEYSCQLTEAGLDINLNYAPRNHLPVPFRGVQRSTMSSRERERTAAQAAQATNNRIHKVSSVAFMLAIRSVHRLSPSRYPRTRTLHRLPSTPPRLPFLASDVYRDFSLTLSDLSLFISHL